MNSYCSEILNSIENREIPPYPYAYPLRSTHRELPKNLNEYKIWEKEKQYCDDEINLYIHFPFCKYKCGFCNLYSIANTENELQNSYINALCKQISNYSQIINGRKIKTIFLGGGTPMLITEQNFLKIMETLTKVSPNWKNDIEEFCIEASPDSIVESDKDGKLKLLIDNGIDRINLGIQSFNAKDIKTIGRDYEEDVNYKAIKILKEYNLKNISTDLIGGFNGQTEEIWVNSINEMVKLSPHTISMYCLRIRPDSRFGREKSHSFKSNPVYYDWYDKAREILLKNGYSQETNVRFKIEGRGGYVQQYYQFNCKPILGIGAGARSYTNTADYIIGGSANPKVDEIQKYIDDAENDTLKIKAGFILDDEERVRRRLVLNLYRFNIKEFRELYQDKFDWIFKEKFEVLLEQGLLDFKDDVYFLTPKGYKYRDIISHSFFSEKVRELDKEFYECLI